MGSIKKVARALSRNWNDNRKGFDIHASQSVQRHEAFHFSMCLDFPNRFDKRIFLCGKTFGMKILEHGRIHIIFYQNSVCSVWISLQLSRFNS